MAEERSLIDMTGENMVDSMERLKGIYDVKERKIESDIYCEQAKIVNEQDKMSLQYEVEMEKLKLEKEKFERELDLKREQFEKELEMKNAQFEKERKQIENFNYIKLNCETEHDKKLIRNERIKLGVGIASTLLTAGMGVLCLKYNMKYGGMTGKDGESWFKELRHVNI